MANLSKITRSQLRSLGLDTDEVAAFLQLRSRVGRPSRDDLVQSDLLSERAREILVPLAAQEGSSVNEEAQSDSGSKPQLLLRMRPAPAMVSDKPFRLAVTHTQLNEDAVVTVERALSPRGPSRHEFHDLSLAHVIELTVLDADENVLVKRVFYPPETDRRFSVETVTGDWTAVPPVAEAEGWSQDGDTIYAELEFATRRTPIQKPVESVVANRFLRAGQYQVIGDPLFRFDVYRLSFAVLDETALKAVGLAAGVDGESEQAWSRSFANGEPALVALLSSTAMARGDLDFEGNFRAERTVTTLDNTKGWLWVLTGADVIAGYVPDQHLADPIETLVIFLPARSDRGATLKDIPYDVSEKALLNRPDLFADDPGTTCQPFDNPGRILGERRFWTVLRVTQPFVEGAGRFSTAPKEEGERPIDFPRNAVSDENPIDYEGVLSNFQARTVTFGHVLEHAVRYRSNGYSLGDVAYSMTLAPRQKRRVLKLDYSRRERSRRVEETVAGDEVSDEMLRDRSYGDSVSSELNEWSRGKSSAKSSAGAAGIGFALGPVVIGGGAVTGSSSSSSSQRGGRSVAASESQQLRDAIRRYGQSLRSQESTVVTETEQTENIEGVSEVVQNINYTRALSVVYYEILRHLRVDTEVAGVGECVFVPMPLLPWDDGRISKHRDVLRRFARGRYEREMFRHIDDVLTKFVGSDIPPGIRADQPLGQLTGSIFIQMGIEMPQEGSDLIAVNQNTDRTIYERELLRIRTAAFLPFSGFFPFPTSFIVEKTLSASDEVRNRYFQSEIAPHMARRYLDSLMLETDNGMELDADFTLVGDYRFGRVVRVDFTVNLAGSTSRADLEKVTVKLGQGIELPVRSFANVRSANMAYSNDYFEGRASSDSGYRDLVKGDTGKRDDNGAVLFFRMTAADRVDFRKELSDAFNDFKKRIAADTFRHHKALWWSMDADALYTLLDGYAFSDSDGRSLASIVEHRPAAIMGNTLVFRTKTDKPIDPMFKNFADLRNHYVGELPYTDPMRISLPTDGLYARAHLDGCVAAEQHNGSFDWVFDNVEPELADFPADMFQSRRAEPQGLMPTQFPETIINLQNAPEAPGVSGLSGVLSSVSNPNSFRDMAGLAGTQASLQGAIGSATSLAGNFGSMAHQQQLAQIKADAEAGKNLKSFGAAVKQQVAEGNMSPESGQRSVEVYAERQATDPATASQKARQQTINTVTQSEDGGTVVAADETGVVAVTKPAKRAPDPSAGVSVVPIPPDQILFMNFKTDSDQLQPDHIRALELLVGQAGLEMANVLRVDGHASKSGSDEHNRELGQRRGNALFAMLNRIMSPLDPDVNFTPDFVFSEGEEGSYRARFQGIPAIDGANGKDHPNDPVEKAVLLTVGGDFAKRPPRSFDFYGVKMEVTNRILIINNYVVYVLPGGKTKVVNRNGYHEEHTYITNIYNIDNSVNIGGDLRLNVYEGGVSIVDESKNYFCEIPVTERGFEQPTAHKATDQPFTDWELTFNAPSLMSEGRQTLEDLLKQVSKLVRGGDSDAPPASSTEFGVLKAALLAAAEDLAFDAFLDLTGLGTVRSILQNVFVGTLTFEGTISAKENSDISASGTFSGPGVMLGDPKGAPDMVILKNQTYATARPISINDWKKMPGGMVTYGFVNQGITPIVPTLISGLKFIVEYVLPFVPGPFKAVEWVLATLEGIGGPTLQFKAMEGDTLKKYGAQEAWAQIGQIYVAAATPKSLVFKSK